MNQNHKQTIADSTLIADLYYEQAIKEAQSKGIFVRLHRESGLMEGTLQGKAYVERRVKELAEERN